MINYISKQQLDECFDDLAMVWLRQLRWEV